MRIDGLVLIDRLLAKSMWHNQKILNINDALLNRKMHAQETLLDIEKTIHISTSERHQEKLAIEGLGNDKSFEKANKNIAKRQADKVFESWLTEQGFKHVSSSIASHKKEASKLPEIPKYEKREEVPKFKKEKTRITSAATTASSFSNLHGILKTKNDETPADDKPDGDPVRFRTPRWNISTRLNKEPYLKNLDDFYPRDPYTLMPTDVELLLLHRELNGLSIEEIKEFMAENFKNKAIQNKQKIDIIESTTKKMHTIKPNTEREHYYKPKNIMDYEPKKKDAEHHYGIDQASFALSRTPTSSCYEKTKSFLVDKYKQTSSPNINNDEVLVDGKNFFELYFDTELYEFMKDKKNGKISKKYEKVFIC
jgi:hypothetical protein